MLREGKEFRKYCKVFVPEKEKIAGSLKKVA
jgi:hypothetical protein